MLLYYKLIILCTNDFLALIRIGYKHEQYKCAWTEWKFIIQMNECARSGARAPVPVVLLNGKCQFGIQQSFLPTKYAIYLLESNESYNLGFVWENVSI